jgi:hypothetical protein
VPTAAEETTPNEQTRASRVRIALSVKLVLAYALVIAALITLRALVDELAFLSAGWIVLLALVPILPWLIPAVTPAVRRIAPFVQTVKIPGGFEISLHSVARSAVGLGAVETVLTSDHLVDNLTKTATPFTSSDAMVVIQGVQSMRSANADAVVVDLGFGRKWRLPNLYFLAWILANDPLTRWLAFVEAVGETPSIFVGTCAAAEVRTGIEMAYPAYAAAGRGLEYQDPAQLQTQQGQQALANEFNKIRAAVAPPVSEDVPVLGWVTTEKLRDLLGPRLSTASVSWTGEIDRAALETIMRSPTQYVGATTADGRFRGLVEQREVLLEFARRVLQAS